MLPERGLDRPRSTFAALPLPDAAQDTGNTQAGPQALHPFDRDGSEGARWEMLDESVVTLEAAGLDWAIIEMRYREYLARSELEALFASGELPFPGT